MRVPKLGTMGIKGLCMECLLCYWMSLLQGPVPVFLEWTMEKEKERETSKLWILEGSNALLKENNEQRFQTEIDQNDSTSIERTPFKHTFSSIDVFVPLVPVACLHVSTKGS